MFPIPYKLTKDVDLGGALRRTVASVSSEDALTELHESISQVQKLRSRITAGKPIALKDLMNYCGILELLMKPLPNGSSSLMDVLQATDPPNVFWSGVYDSSYKETRFNATLEYYYTLFNIAILCNNEAEVHILQLASSGSESLDPPRKAKAILDQMVKDYESIRQLDHSSEFSLRSISMFQKLMSAQLRACCFYRVQRKNPVWSGLAGLATATASDFEEVIRLINESDLGPQVSYLKSFFVSKPRNFILEYAEFQTVFFKAAARFYHTVLYKEMKLKEGSEIRDINGELFAGFKEANQCIKQLEKLPTDKISLGVKRIANTLAEKIAAEFRTADKDQLIYHMPTPSSLEPIKPIEREMKCEFEIVKTRAEELYGQFMTILSHTKDFDGYKQKLVTFVASAKNQCANLSLHSEQKLQEAQEFVLLNRGPVSLPGGIWGVVQGVVANGGLNKLLNDIADIQTIAREISDMISSLERDASIKYPNVDKRRLQIEIRDIQRQTKNAGDTLKRIENDLEKHKPLLEKFDLPHSMFAAALDSTDCQAVINCKKKVEKLKREIQQSKAARANGFKTLESKASSEMIVTYLKGVEPEDYETVFNQVLDRNGYSRGCSQMINSMENESKMIDALDAQVKELQYEYARCGGIIIPETVKNVQSTANAHSRLSTRLGDSLIEYQNIKTRCLQPLVEQLSREERSSLQRHRAARELAAAGKERHKQQQEAERKLYEEQQRKDKERRDMISRQQEAKRQARNKEQERRQRQQMEEEEMNRRWMREREEKEKEQEQEQEQEARWRQAEDQRRRQAEQDAKRRQAEQDAKRRQAEDERRQRAEQDEERRRQAEEMEELRRTKRERQDKEQIRKREREEEETKKRIKEKKEMIQKRNRRRSRSRSAFAMEIEGEEEDDEKDERMLEILEGDQKKKEKKKKAAKPRTMQEILSQGFTYAPTKSQKRRRSTFGSSLFPSSSSTVSSSQSQPIASSSSSPSLYPRSGTPNKSPGRPRSRAKRRRGDEEVEECICTENFECAKCLGNKAAKRARTRK